jgi:hypothetical protein
VPRMLGKDIAAYEVAKIRRVLVAAGPFLATL